MFAPPLVHWKLNGPVPEGAPEQNVAEEPGQTDTFVGPVAVVFVKTVKVAQLVTLLQKPETFTQYCPASPLTTDGIV